MRLVKTTSIGKNSPGFPTLDQIIKANLSKLMEELTKQYFTADQTALTDSEKNIIQESYASYPLFFLEDEFDLETILSKPGFYCYLLQDGVYIIVVHPNQSFNHINLTKGNYSAKLIKKLLDTLFCCFPRFSLHMESSVYLCSWRCLLDCIKHCLSNNSW